MFFFLLLFFFLVAQRDSEIDRKLICKFGVLCLVAFVPSSTTATTMAVKTEEGVKTRPWALLFTELNLRGSKAFLFMLVCRQFLACLHRLTTYVAVVWPV